MRYIWILLTILAGAGMFKSCSIESEQASVCGVVKYKIDATRFSKHHADADPIMVMAFDDGRIKEIHPNWNTYMSHKQGDRLCFTVATKKAEEYRSSKMYFIIFILLYFTFFGSMVGAVWCWGKYFDKN